MHLQLQPSAYLSSDIYNLGVYSCESTLKSLSEPGPPQHHHEGQPRHGFVGMNPEPRHESVSHSYFLLMGRQGMSQGCEHARGASPPCARLRPHACSRPHGGAEAARL